MIERNNNCSMSGDQQFAVLINELTHIRDSIDKLEQRTHSIQIDHETRLRTIEQVQNEQKGKMAVVAVICSAAVATLFTFISRVIGH